MRRDPAEDFDHPTPGSGSPDAPAYPLSRRRGPLGGAVNMGDGGGEVLSYHRLSMHRPERYAPGPGGLDWATQPAPFRQYRGCRQIELLHRPLEESPPTTGCFPGRRPRPLGSIAAASRRCSTTDWRCRPGRRPAALAGRCGSIRRAATCIPPKPTCCFPAVPWSRRRCSPTTVPTSMPWRCAANCRRRWLRCWMTACRPAAASWH